jgi:molybdate transport system substrate-binding protein
MEALVAELAKSSPELKVNVTYGSSGNFFAQISNEAPFDVFMSADADYPRKLVDAKLALPDTFFSYAVGSLALWARKDSGLAPDKRGAALFTEASVKRIAIANPRHAPYGRAAEAALKALGVHAQVESKLVLAENVAQAAQFAQSGAADVALLAHAWATAPPLAALGSFWHVPTELHPPLEQAGVILAKAKNVEAARELRAFLIGGAARKIFEAFGFGMPGA